MCFICSIRRTTGEYYHKEGNGADTKVYPPRGSRIAFNKVPENFQPGR
jgi:hypothetical protein